MTAAVLAEPTAAASTSLSKSQAPASTSQASASSSPPIMTAEAPAAASAPAPVFAALGSKPPDLGDSQFPIYARPLYPFDVLDPKEARLLPPPDGQIFSTYEEAMHAVQEHGLHQGYKLEPYFHPKDGNGLRCETGSSCRHLVLFREVDQGGFVALPGVEGHSHGPSLRVGVFHWKRNLTQEEFSFVVKRRREGHLKTIQEAQNAIHASRKRLSDRAPLPDLSLFELAWNHDTIWASLTSSSSSSTPSSTPPSSPPSESSVLPSWTSQRAPASPAAPARPVRSSAAVPPVDESWLEVVRICESIKPGRRSTSRYVNYKDNGPWIPRHFLDPATCRLRSPPSGQIFYDQAKAAYLLQTYALLQGYELKTDLGSMDAYLQCQGAPGCPYELVLRGRGRHKVWDLEDCHERHNHLPDLEAGLRVWRRGLTEAEIKYIRTRKRQGRLETIVDARVAIELSRKRAGGYIPMPMPSAYDAVWNEEDNAGGNGNKRMRLASTSRLPEAAPVVPSRVSNSSNSLPPPSFASISGSTIPSAPFPMAPYFHPATSQNELINGLGHMIIQLWPYGVSDPQSKVRAAVKAMLDLDVQQQQQQQRQQQHSRP